MSTPPPKPIIAIIGAGIAGPVLALHILSHPTLRELYVPVIYEKLPEPNASDGSSVAGYAAGAAVALTSNALFPLYELGLREEIDGVSAECERIQIWRFWSGSGGKEGVKRRYNEVVNPGWKADLGTNLRIIERSALQRVLIERVLKLGGRVEWGRRLVGIEERDDSSVGLEFQGCDGNERLRVDFLVGADGCWSRVRKHIMCSSEPGVKGKEDVGSRWKPEFSGADGIYGVSRRVVGDGCEEGKPGDTHWIMLDCGSASTWALPGGKQFWTLALRSYTPPSRGGGKDGVVKMYGADTSTGGYTIESTKEILEKHEGVWHPVAGSFGELFRNSERIVRSPLWHRAWEAEDIGNSKMSVIGDASRVMVPSSGQGACFGIEDATVLANCLLNHPGDFVAAVMEYTTERAPRSKSMANQSYWTGLVTLADRWWWRWIRDVATKWIPMSKDPRKGEPKDPMGWLYNVRYKVALRDTQEDAERLPMS